MIFTLFLACILPGKELVGDSDRPFDPSISNFEADLGMAESSDLDSGDDSETGEETGGAPEPEEPISELSASVSGDNIYIEHYGVHLPCDFETSEASISVDTDEFLVEIVYSEREPDGCYNNLSYTLDFEGAPSGTYTLEAHGDETTFDF